MNETSLVSKLEQYDHAQRAAATEAGRPLPRAVDALPTPTHPDGLHVIGWTGKQLVHFIAGDTAYLPLEEDQLAYLDSLRHTLPILFTDTSAFSKFIRLCDQQRHFGFANLLRWRQDRPSSYQWPILVQQLEHRFWLPHDLTSSLRGWMTAFRISSRSFTNAVNLLLEVAQPEDEPAPYRDKFLGSVIRAEARSAFPASSRQLQLACQSFSYAKTIEEAYTAFVATDPGLIERNLLAGLLTSGKLITTDTFRKQISLQTVGRLKLDNRYILLNEAGHMLTKATLWKVSYVDEQLTATFHHREPAGSSETIYVAAEPFLMAPRRATTNRWSNGPRPQRTVPKYIVAAGGPKEV